VQQISSSKAKKREVSAYLAGALSWEAGHQRRLKGYGLKSTCGQIPRSVRKACNNLPVPPRSLAASCPRVWSKSAASRCLSRSLATQARPLNPRSRASPLTQDGSWCPFLLEPNEARAPRF